MNLVAYLAQGYNKGAGIPELSSRETPTAETLGRAAQALMLSFLLASGGACKHPVFLRHADHTDDEEGTIQEVALWDIPTHVPLQLGKRSSHILQCLQDAFTQDIRLRLPGPELHSGEPFLYHALYLRVREDERLRYFASALRKASPLTRLCTCPVIDDHPAVTTPEGQQGRPALTREECEGLLSHPAMPFLLGYLADQWSALDAPQPSMAATLQLERLNARYATIAQCLQTCIALGKIAQLSLFPLFFQRLLQRHFPDKAQSTLQIAQWRISDREELLRGYISLLSLGQTFEEHFQREVIQPGIHGWRYPQQTRIFVRKYGRLWSTGGLGAKIQEARRALRGQMG